MFRHIQIINSWWYIPLYPETSFRYGSLMLVISSIIIIIQDVQPSTVTPPKNRTHIYHGFGRCFLPFLLTIDQHHLFITKYNIYMI